MNIVESPCVKNCCLDEDDVCMGCCRTLDEIKDWTSLTDAQKTTVLHLCTERRASKVKNSNKIIRD